jgi:GntR family transcriptional regulator
MKSAANPGKPPMMNLTEASPLYKQMIDRLHEQIETGFYKPGQMIPSERVLCKSYGVSRITVRRCISEMIHEGVLFRQHGKGSFVARRQVRQGLARIVSFSRTVMELGMQPSTAVLSSELIAADPHIAKVFNLPASASVLKLSLLGKGDEEPLVLYESYFRPELGRKMVRKAIGREEEGVAFSTYDLYGEEIGIVPVTVNQTFEATTTNDRISAALKLKKGFPILLITSVFMNQDQEPLEFRRAMYRGDRYKFHIQRDFSA